MRYLFSVCLLLSINFTIHAQQATMSQDSGPASHSIVLNPEDISPLLIGEHIPKADLQNVDGKNIELYKQFSMKPTVLVFYRGGWCPYCSRQLAGLQAVEKDLLKQGYQIIAVSTDSPENLKKSMDGAHLSYTLLSDADLALAKQMGLAYRAPKNYDSFLGKASGDKNTDNLLPVPAVFIIDKTGSIRFEYINPNFKERISEGLLKAVSSQLASELK